MIRRPIRYAAATAAIAGALCAAAAIAVPVLRAETIALTGATVHTVSGPTLDNATVVMTDGKIAAVGKNVTPPAGAKVVSCAGKHIYPGMISANSVLGLIEVGSVLGTNDQAETGNVNPNVRAEVEINPESDLIPVTRVNGITSAVSVPQGGAIAGTSALIHLDGWTQEDMTIAKPVGLHVRWPAMRISRAWFETRSEDEQKKARDQAIQAIRDAFDDARAYWTARDAEGKTGIPRHDRDVKWDAMGKALRGEIPVVFNATTYAQIRGVLRFVDEQKLKNVVLEGGSDAWMLTDELKARNIAVITAAALALPERSYEAYDTGMGLAGKLQAAGVRYCVSDGGGSHNSRNLPYEAAMAAAYGLPKDEALKSITLYPAQILGVADRLGSIDTGKIADVIVTNGDPLEIATQVEQVYIGGRPISMETRHTRLFHKYDARPRGPHARARGATATTSTN
ncbi:MAG: amidohydrolase family protein [Candidatus Eisenbacteria bacterium]|nr:amidohydrolase family protein [Candidatus Eisenbacteria bacterium]